MNHRSTLSDHIPPFPLFPCVGMYYFAMSRLCFYFSIKPILENDQLCT